jgi:hypothetical protein
MKNKLIDIITEWFLISCTFAGILFFVLMLTVGMAKADDVPTDTSTDTSTEVPPCPEEYQDGLKT